jgi:hypothetical protein
MPDVTGPTVRADPADRILRRAFPPWHKRALGLAVGCTFASIVILLTMVDVLLSPARAPDLALLANYFVGYEVSMRGAMIGGWWAFVAGFVAGWFTAFILNLSTATWVLVVKARHDLTGTTDFLDHI